MAKVKATRVRPRFTKPSGERMLTEAEQQDIYALDVPQAKDLTAAMCALAATIWHGKSMSKTQLDTMKQLGDVARPVIEKLHLGGNEWDGIIKEAHGTGDVFYNREKLDSILKGMVRVEKELRLNPQQNPILLDLLTAARRGCGDSESGYQYVEKNVGLLKHHALNSVVEEGTGGLDQHSQDSHRPAWDELVKKLGGKEGQHQLDMKQTIRAREKKATTYQEYLDLRRQLFDKAKAFIRSFVRSHANKAGLTDYQKLLEAMEKHRIHVHSLPQGFEGFIDDQGRLYTKHEKLIDGVPGGRYGGAKVIMNPDYDPHKDDTNVFRAIIPGAATVPLYYTHDMKTKGKDAKFKGAAKLGERLPALRREWRDFIKEMDIDEDQHDPDYLAAVVLEMLYQTSARVGSVGNQTKIDPTTKKKSANGVYMPTYALSTLLCKHIRQVGHGINISYPGKSYMGQKHAIYHDEGPASRKIIKMLLKWKSERKPDEPLFQTKRGAALGGSYVNEMLRYLLGEVGVNTEKMDKSEVKEIMKVGVHKIRTHKGTEMMTKIVEANPFKKKKFPTPTTEVRAWLKKSAEDIGKQLGHFSGTTVTSATAIANYCNPDVTIQLYKDARTSPSRDILKLVGVDPHSLDGWTDPGVADDKDLDEKKVEKDDGE